MRNLAVNEISHISGGYSGYDMEDVIDDISGFALLGIFVNTYQTGKFNTQVVMAGAYLGTVIGAAYSSFNYVGYNYVVN